MYFYSIKIAVVIIIVLYKMQALAIASIVVPMVSSLTVTNGNFTLLGSYLSNALPISPPGNGYLGGGSIVGNELLLVVRAELPESHTNSSRNS